MKRLLKEPLLHFLIAGGLLFVGYLWLNPSVPNTSTNPQAIRIGPGEVKWLTETWVRQWRRDPTVDELRMLVTNLLREELLAREAREMRLDENDTIVRRRLAQKLEFLIRDTSRLLEPSDDELRRLYEAAPDDYSTAPRVSFTHVYFSRERRKDATADAVASLARLASLASGSTADVGDRLLVDAEFRDADRQAVASAFGPDFARAVFALQPGVWQGPIESGFGVHLVRVEEAQPARRREFADVKPELAARWREDRQRQSEERYFERLLEKYEVAIDESVKSRIGSLSFVRAKEASR